MIIYASDCHAQEQEKVKASESTYLGLNHGYASQDNFLFHNKNYNYSNHYYKLQFNTPLHVSKILRLEAHLEPSIYISRHQLLNIGFIGEDRVNYQDLRNEFSMLKSFREYALNAGLLLRFKLSNQLSSYALGSIGPMIGEKRTERLAKGFAFSDIFGIGLAYDYQFVRFDFRMMVRHNSNAYLNFPNHGHNSLGFEAGIWFKLP